MGRGRENECKQFDNFVIYYCLSSTVNIRILDLYNSKEIFDLVLVFCVLIKSNIVVQYIFLLCCTTPRIHITDTIITTTTTTTIYQQTTLINQIKCRRRRCCRRRRRRRELFSIEKVSPTWTPEEKQTHNMMSVPRTLRNSGYIIAMNYYIFLLVCKTKCKVAQRRLTFFILHLDELLAYDNKWKMIRLEDEKLINYK